MRTYIILAPIFLPLAGAVIIALVSRLYDELSGFLATAFSLLTFGLVLWLYNLYAPGKNLHLAFNVGLPFKLSFGADSLSLYLALITTFIWTLASLYAIEYITERKILFNVFLMLSLYGMLGIVFTANLFSLLIFFEVFSVASAVLVIHEGTREAQRAGFQYLFISIVGSVAIILATAAIFTTTGSMDLLAGPIAALKNNPLTPLFFWLMVVGFAVKAGMWPVHMWLPEAHPIAPSPASALLSGVMIKAGAYGLIRVVYGIFGFSVINTPFTGKLLLLLAIITILLGSIMAIVQTELKRMLAYSSVGQIGYVVLGIALLSQQGLAGGVLHIFNHAVMKATLFMAAGIIIHQTGLRNLEDLAGLGKRLPLTMTAFTLAALSMIGVPPLIGFFSKWYLALGALQARDNGFITPLWAYIVVATLILSGLLNIVYYGPIIIRGWFKGPEGGEDEAASHHGHGHALATANDNGHPESAIEEPSWLMLMPTFILGALTLILGIYINIPYKLSLSVVRLFF